MNDNKKELINKIEEALEEKGFSSAIHFARPGYDTFVESLRWLPEKNLEGMLQTDISKCTDFDAAFQAYGRAGVFKFKPYMVPQDICENPCLCIRRDRFMHMFRGYHFQVSATVDGREDCESGAYRMDFLTKASYHTSMMRESLISYMLWWGSFISVGFCFDNVREIFNTDKDVLEEYLHTCMHFWGTDAKYTWTDVEKYIAWSIGSIDIKARNLYQLCDKGSSNVHAYIAIGKKTVQIELMGNKLLTLTLPDLNEGVGYNLEDEDDLMEYECDVEVLERNHYLEILTIMALFLCNIKINFTVWYWLAAAPRNIVYRKAANIKDMNSVNDIHNCIPDEF